MPKFNVVVCVPSTGQCKAQFAYSLARMVAYFAQHPIYPDVEEQNLEIRFLEGSGISANREKLINDALALEDMTHVLFIDEDMGFQPNVLHILASRRQSIVACNYRMRVPPSPFTALAMDTKRRIETVADNHGLEEAYYTGFGFALIERKVFEAVKGPRFPLFWNEVTQTYTTEDHPFFVKAREKGFPCYVDHNASRQVWHHGSINYCWQESYETLNQHFKAYEGDTDGK